MYVIAKNTGKSNGLVTVAADANYLWYQNKSNLKTYRKHACNSRYNTIFTITDVKISCASSSWSSDTS